MFADRRAVSIAYENSQFPLAEAALSPVCPDVVPHHLLCHVQIMKICFSRPLRLTLTSVRNRNRSQDRHDAHFPACSVGVPPTRFLRFPSETRVARGYPVHGLWMFRGLLGETCHFGLLRGLPPPLPTAPPRTHSAANEVLREAACQVDRRIADTRDDGFGKKTDQFHAFDGVRDGGEEEERTRCAGGVSSRLYFIRAASHTS